MCSLSDAQKKAIACTWDKFTENQEANGKELFLCFFKKHPNYQDLFVAMKGKSEDELKGSDSLRNHGLKATGLITDMVKSFGDAEKLKGIVQKNAKDHFARKVQAAYFKDLAEVIVCCVASKNEGNFSDDTKQAWIAFMKGMCDVTAAEEAK